MLIYWKTGGVEGQAALMPPGRRVRDGVRPKSAGRVGAVWERIRATVLANSDVCGICGHPGSGDVDHIISKEKAPELVEDLENLQPSHGASSRCYTCDPIYGRNCNREKGTGDMEVMLITTEQWFG
jgi:5-methylcytosine-specific restriction endonuclease McrA